MASPADAVAAMLAEGLAAFDRAAFRPGQAEAVQAALQKRDSLVILPTGGGKSLCYLMPALVQPGLAVVVSPLRALMKDQQDGASKCINITALQSDTPEHERQAVFAQLEGSSELKLKCLLVSPEMLNVNKRLCKALQGLAQRGLLSLIAVDEAHCVFDWGLSFRGSYLQLPAFFDSLTPRPPVMALTASANGEGRAKIVSLLGLRDPLTVQVSLNRKNIRYEVRYPDAWAANVSQDADMVALLREPDARGQPLRCGIVYCRSKKECDRVAALLCDSGLLSAAYHAGLSDSRRKALQADWVAGRVYFTVATVAFGMGIDKADVQVVIHCQVPPSMASWYQESGRAGRDGLPARNVVYYTAQEQRTMVHLLSKQASKELQAGQKANERAQHQARIRLANSQKRHDFRAVMEACRTPKCLRAALLCSFDETLPRGACIAAGSAGCSVCSDVRCAEASIAAMIAAEANNDPVLHTLRTAIAQGPAGMRELDLDGFRFGLPSDDEKSSDEGGDSSDDGGDSDAGLAADVALGARGGGSEHTLNALMAAEEAAEAARGGAGGRSALAAELFAHRRPLPAAAAGRSVDAALRDVWRTKLTKAMGGDAGAAAKAEVDVHLRCRDLPSQYDRMAQQVELDAKRAAMHPAGAPGPQAGAPTMRRGFVPPRTVPPPQKAEAAAAAPPPPKLKSTRIGDPLPSEMWAAKQAKTS